jgi:hypothetical protein
VMILLLFSYRLAFRSSITAISNEKFVPLNAMRLKKQ